MARKKKSQEIENLIEESVVDGEDSVSYVELNKGVLDLHEKMLEQPSEAPEEELNFTPTITSEPQEEIKIEPVIIDFPPITVPQTYTIPETGIYKVTAPVVGGGSVAGASKITSEPNNDDLIITLTGDRDAKVQIEKGFNPGATWWTSANDTKNRFSAGVFVNTQLGKYGTLRVEENGTLQYLKHTDFKKTTKGKSGIIDTFIAVRRNEKEILERRTILVKLS